MSRRDRWSDVLYVHPKHDVHLGQYSSFVLAADPDSQAVEIREFKIEGDIITVTQCATLADAFSKLGKWLSEESVPYTIEELP